MIQVLAAALALPVVAQQAPLSATVADPPERHVVAPSAGDPACTLEHADMGHCEPVPSAPPTDMTATDRLADAPLTDPCCSPDDTVAGDCIPSHTAPPSHDGPSVAALSGPLFAADAVWGADRMLPTRRAIYAEHGTFRGGAVILDRLEYHARDGRNGYAWEGAAWYGGDYDRLWVKSEGEGSFGQFLATADVQGLWSHALDPWFDLQSGVRYEMRPGPGRAQLIVGVQGVAPYWLEIDAAAFLSTRGELTGRVEIDYDQRITSRLILQPRAEFDLAAQASSANGIRAGLRSIIAGLRLRYEVKRELAPYIGVEYDHDFDDAPELTKVGREARWRLLAGLRAWF